MKCPVCGKDEVVTSLAIKNNLVFRCKNCLAEFLENYKDRRFSVYTKLYYESWNLKEKNVSTERIKRLNFKSLFQMLEDSVKKRFDGNRLIDIGCATGYMLDVAKEKGCEVYGVELSKWACSQAGKRHQNVFNKPLEECSFSDDFFDIVSMTDILEHIGSPRMIFKEIKRILKPGGYILITSPDNLSWSRKIMGGKWFQFKDEHVIYYNKKALSDVCSRQGFEIIYIMANRKIMCLDYLYTQFTAYRVFLISELIALAYKIFSDELNSRPFKVPISGEFAAILRNK